MSIKWIIVIAAVVIIAIAAAYYLSSHGSGSASSVSAASPGKVDFVGGNGVISTVGVELADTPQKQETGLMYRTSMDEDKGMLFIFSGEYPLSFWMRNTELPLDMVFVNSSLAIVDINHNATPMSDTTFTARAPAKYVVEVNGGYCDEHGIKIGDKIKIY